MIGKVKGRGGSKCRSSLKRGGARGHFKRYFNVLFKIF